jgi:ATP-dependent Clp protease ATP-binding subunit ClpB
MTDTIAKLKGLSAHLHQRIRGQEQVIPRVCSVLERAELGLHPPGRPKGSLLFLGPTGVGKTELAIAFTEYLFGHGTLFRFDMSEYQHEDSVKLFIGDETGRLGRLGEVLRDHRWGTLFFDEMEKAHPLILDLYLQMLDTARVTFGTNSVADLSGFYLVFTSNLGGQEVMHQTNARHATLERIIDDVLHDELRPEFIARIQERIVFRKLSFQTQREIAQITLERELARMREKGFHLTASTEAIEFLVRKGIHKTHGARPMRNTVERYVGDAVRHALLEGEATSGNLAPDALGQCLLIVPSSK